MIELGGGLSDDAGKGVQGYERCVGVDTPQDVLDMGVHIADARGARRRAPASGAILEADLKTGLENLRQRGL